MSFSPEFGIQALNCVFKNRTIAYKVSPIGTFEGFDEFFEEIKNKIISLGIKELEIHRSINLSMLLVEVGNWSSTRK